MIISSVNRFGIALLTAAFCFALPGMNGNMKARAGGRDLVTFGAGVVTGLAIGAMSKKRNVRRKSRRNNSHSSRTKGHRSRRSDRTITHARREDVRKMQSALNSLGFDAGTVDGVAGEGTRRAVRRFQASYGYQQTGHLTKAQRSHLLQASRNEMLPAGNSVVAVASVQPSLPATPLPAKAEVAAIFEQSFQAETAKLGAQ
ncbi:nitrogen regulatory protein PII [Rhodobium orientis]|uniref:Peptidoglycan binding-like domain-containing protein n=1 Tax=Rhodobium orientis TaxID=34017 RepID=A0A327JHN7_9HYPH|nr:peptidoglycan-binding domain-containing protein [Rhodobium orientis]MBB4302113.1 nitrogen regulatory protein PII [Rhodobium orientis]MBK5951299.1 hypothetical protein [Rhodobium orientis]RAI25907.1 hypothetical protein CH339_16355 [Rhodobium orientis]